VAARTEPAFSPTAAKPELLSGSWTAKNLQVSKQAALLTCRFLSRCRTINTHPGLARRRERIGAATQADAAALAAEAAIAAGTLQRRRVTAEEATPLPKGVCVTTSRALRFIRNAAGFKGVHSARAGEYSAELFDGATRYNLGTFASAGEAAEAYDRACIRVRAVTQPQMLNFPMSLYVEESRALQAELAAKRERQAAEAAAAEAAGGSAAEPEQLGDKAGAGVLLCDEGADEAQAQAQAPLEAEAQAQAQPEAQVQAPLEVEARPAQADNVLL
jgi:hypothetical protein